MKNILLASVLAFAAAPALANGPSTYMNLKMQCHEAAFYWHEEIAVAPYNERQLLVGTGVDRTAGIDVQVWANKNTGTYTILMIMPDATTCLVSGGINAFITE